MRAKTSTEPEEDSNVSGFVAENVRNLMDGQAQTKGKAAGGGVAAT